jgi:Ca2+-binding EF-hand superfamily protein
MSGPQRYDNQFNRADANHDGTIDEREFRQFLGPVIKDERRLSGTLNPQDIQNFAVTFLFPI